MTTQRRPHLNQSIGPVYQPGDPVGPFRTPGPLAVVLTQAWAEREYRTGRDEELRSTDSAGGNRDILQLESVWTVNYHQRAAFRIGNIFRR